MSRYFPLIILTFLQACGMKSIHQTMPLSLSDNSVNENFNKTDLYLMYALDAKYRDAHSLSAAYFEKLYDVNQELLYAYEAIKAYIMAKEYKEIKRVTDKALKVHPNDNNLKRYLAAFYIDNKEFKKAKTLLLPLIETENNEKDRTLLATAQIGLGEYQKALSYYQHAYKKNKSAKTLIPYVNLLYYSLNQKAKAKKLLYTHTGFVECDEKVCYKLLEIYQKEQDLNGLLTISEKLFMKTRDPQFAKIAMDIFAYQKDDKGAISFLERTHFDDVVLLRYYVGTKNYPKALALAKTLYKQSGDLHFLAQEAMVEYESYKVPNAKLIAKVQKKFEKVIATLNEASYNNFYGYILIDHNLDIEKGITLIKKALEKEPNAPFYIDSLAWGYYKQQKYQKAYELLEPIMNEITEKEVIEHFEAIKVKLKGKQP